MLMVIYDNNGTVYFAGEGYPEPDGLQYMTVDVPEGKCFKGVDVSVTPHQPILEDIPKSEVEILKEELISIKEENTNNQLALAEIYEMMI